MKRKLLCLLTILIISLTRLFPSSGNQQKIYSVDSSTFQDITTLYILEGKGLPSSSGPWSEDELRLMMEKFNPLSLSSSSLKLYNSIMEELEVKPTLKSPDENLSFKFGLKASIENYYHINDNAFSEEEDWVYGFSKRKPFLTLYVETWATECFYAYFELSISHNLGYNTYRIDGSYEGGVPNGLYKNKENMNIPIVNALLFSPPQNANGNSLIFADFDVTTPYKALASTGSKNWNIVAGRDKISWGDGVTGNLLLSSSFPRHTFIRFSTYFKHFKYQLLFSFFPSPDTIEDANASLDGFKALLVHRVEFTFLGDKIGLALNEACMFWSIKGQNFNLFQINPFGFFHDEYIASNANSLLVIEAKYSPIKHLALYFQFAIDDLRAPGEGKKDVSAYGILGGVKTAFSVGKGILTSSLEVAKTDPFLYLRGLSKADVQQDASKRVGYGYDAIFRMISSERIILRRMCTAYTYGNDVIVLDLRGKYEEKNKYNVGLDISFILHGSMDISSEWNIYEGKYEDAPLVSTPSKFNPFEDYDPITKKTTEHSIEKILSFTLSFEHFIFNNFSLYGIVTPVFIWDKDNISGNYQDDLQIVLGVKYTL